MSGKRIGVIPPVRVLDWNLLGELRTTVLGRQFGDPQALMVFFESAFYAPSGGAFLAAHKDRYEVEDLKEFFMLAKSFKFNEKLKGGPHQT